MTENRPLRVFLCHASQDKQIVRELRKCLAAEGWIDPWLDEEKISLGQHWTTVIEDALESSDLVIIFLSKNSVRKEGFVQRELSYAWELSLEKPHNVIFLIPFRLDECDVPRYLRSRQWGDYFGEKKETSYQHLIRSLKQRHQQKLQLEAEMQAQNKIEDEARKNLDAKNGKEILSQKLTQKKTGSASPLPSVNYQDKTASTSYQHDKRLPPLSILLADQNARSAERMINQTARMIEKTLADFGVQAIVIGFRVGPAVIQFAVQPFSKKTLDIKEDEEQIFRSFVKRMTSLQIDLALALAANRLHVEPPLPGKPYVNVEVPNPNASVVRMRSILEASVFQKLAAPLTIALGRDVSGQPIIVDLARMPHLLVGGTTGSGKSVFMTSIATCLAMNNSSDDLRMVMIDSRMGQLLSFNGLSHLYGKVETNIERILSALRWVILEMEHRYRLLEAAHSHDLATYNLRLSGKEGVNVLPRIVVLIDELADLMMSAPNQTEHSLVRLAQMAHVTGIHLIVTTHRPSMDVVTSLVKENFPARIAFAVASGVDSRVILDTTGAESLLGRGDMLFLNPELGNLTRAQAVMITDMEIERIIAHWQKNAEVSTDAPPWERLLSEPEKNENEQLIEKAVYIVRQNQRASASLLQRRLRIGYPRAARLLDQLEEMGVIGPSKGGGTDRDILMGSTEHD